MDLDNLEALTDEAQAYLDLQNLVYEQILISRSFAGRVLDVGGPEHLAIAGLEFAQLLRQSIEGGDEYEDEDEDEDDE
jgi:hypothetical protein